MLSDYDLLRTKAKAYKRLFGGGPDAQIVLADLARFCHRDATTHVTGDTHGSAQLEGRRQVILRITGYAELSEAQMRAMYEQENEE